MLRTEQDAACIYTKNNVSASILGCNLYLGVIMRFRAQEVGFGLGPTKEIYDRPQFIGGELVRQEIVGSYEQGACRLTDLHSHADGI